MEENKVRTKTEDFKIALQAKIAEVLGVKVSKQKAWELFKDMVKVPYEYILGNYDAAGKPAILYGQKHKELELPLSGVGTYKIITVGKEDALSVKPRLYLSSSIENMVKTRLGFATDGSGDGDGEDEIVNDTPAAPAEDLDLEI